MHTMAQGEIVPGSVYLYDPVNWAPPMFTAWFGVVTIAHVWQCIRYKAWKVTGLHPVCSLLFTVGFALRSYGAIHYKDINVYIASTIFIYCAPPILELANYHVLGRILYYVPYYAPLHPGRTLTTFGFVSGIVEILNGVGVSWLANPAVNKDFVKLGEAFLKVSLILQIVVIAAFCFIAALFHRRCIAGGITTRKVQAPLLTLYISMFLILFRTVYRIVEHFAATRIYTASDSALDLATLSSIVRYECFFWAFAASPTLINSVLWNYRHPRRYLPRDYRVYLAQDGKTELRGPGWHDHVSWWVTFVDPCEMLAALKGRKPEESPFWEKNGYAAVGIDEGSETCV